MAINVECYPNRNFQWLFFTPMFNVDINQAVKDKLRPGEQLTNATALRIFKQIKWKSDMLSLLTKPIVSISLSCIVLLAGFFIPASGIALYAARVFVSTVGGSMVGYSFENGFNGFLPLLSRAYRDQSQRASEYIRIIENAAGHEKRFVLA